MSGPTMPEDADLTPLARSAERALVPVPQYGPARFERYPPEIMGRAFELWSTIAGRSGARVVRLLRRESEEGTALPTPSTVNRWALDGAWVAKADADLERSHGRTVYELQVGWLAGLRLAQQTLLDGMAGAFDDLPMSGAARIKSAEIVLRTIERAGLLAVLPQPPQPEPIDTSELSLAEQEARANARLVEALRQDVAATRRRTGR
jgi:hypothetical protein